MSTPQRILGLSHRNDTDILRFSWDSAPFLLIMRRHKTIWSYSSFCFSCST